MKFLMAHIVNRYCTNRPGSELMVEQLGNVCAKVLDENQLIQVKN